jgi:hypothetical protein
VRKRPSLSAPGLLPWLEDAIRHHLNVQQLSNAYSSVQAGVAPDLTVALGPSGPVLAKLDPLLVNPIVLNEEEFRQLVDFVKFGLLDSRTKPDNLMKLVPAALPSGRTPLHFEFPARATEQ